MRIGLISVLFSCFFYLDDALAKDLRLVTEDYPYFNIVNEKTGEITGSSTEKVMEIMRRADQKYTISAYPWNRAFQMSKSDPDTCLFSTAMTPERAALFKWVGPLVKKNTWHIYARADDTRHPKTLEDLRPYVIGVYRQALASEVLSLKKYKTEIANSDTDNPRKLLYGRFDFWASSNMHGMAILKNQGLSEKIIPLFQFYQAKLYLACNLGVAQDRIDHFNQILKEMELDGTVASIEKKYKQGT